MIKRNLKQRTKRVIAGALIAATLMTQLTAFAQEEATVQAATKATFEVTIQDDKDCKLTSEKKEYEPGEKVTIEVDKNMYFEFEGIEVTGSTSGENVGFSNTHTSLSFEMPEESVSVKALGYNLRGDSSTPVMSKQRSGAAAIKSHANYLIDNVDKKYVENPADAKPADIMPVKYTLTEADVTSLHEALASENIHQLYPTEGTVTLYDLDANSDYYVALLDAMMWTESATLLSSDFAYSNLDGESVSDVIYDKETGLAYVPKAYTQENKEKSVVGNITGQLLYQVQGSEIEKAVNIVNNGTDGVFNSFEFRTSYYAQTTVVQIAEPGTEIKDLSVKINGTELISDQFAYEQEDGSLFVNMQALKVASVDVEIGEPAPKARQARVAEDWNQSSSNGIKPTRWKFTDTPSVGEFFLLEGQEIVQWDSINDPTLSYAYQTPFAGDPDLNNFFNNILNGNMGELTNFDEYQKVTKLTTQNWRVLNESFDATSSKGTTLTIASEGTTYYALKCIHIEKPFGDVSDSYIDENMWAQNQNVGIRIIDVTHANDSNPYILAGIVSTNHNARDPENDYAQQGAGVFKIPVEKSSGTASISKTSANTEVTEGNDYYSLEGAVYGVYSDKGATKKVAEFTTNADGDSNEVSLSAGTYYVKEITAPKGYHLDSNVYTVNVTSGKHTTVDVQDVPKDDPIAVLVNKVDAETGEAVPQGGASLAGAQYTFKFYPTLLADENVDPATEGHVAAREWVFETDADGFLYFSENWLVSGDEFYKNVFGDPSLPIGTLTIQETQAPNGYLLNDELFVRQIKENHVTGSIETYNIPISNESVLRGGVEVSKMDIETGEAQGGATLEGAQIEIVNMNPNAVLVGGVSYENGEAVLTLTTDANGYATTDASTLPAGTYLAREIAAPEGYLIMGETERAFTVATNGEIVDLTTDSTAIKDEVIRGGLEIAKFDSELDANTPQSGATLEGAVFNIINRNENPVLVNGALYALDTVVMTVTTDANGRVIVPGNTLPYGNYTITEVEAPEGYMLEGTLTRDFTITEDGVVLDMTTTDTAIKNDIIRGDLELVKIADGTMERMAGVPFKITNTVSGESQIIVTDENGYASTSSEWNLHSSNTNRGEKDTDGVWFGKLDQLDDNKGAMPYGTYMIEELPCEVNAEMVLFEPFEVTIKRPNYTVDLGTLTNDFEKKPVLETSAYNGANGDKMGEFSEETIITDLVEFKDVEPGVYTMEGILMDKATGEEFLVNGKPVTATKEFTVEDGKTSGSVSLDFVFDGTSLEGVFDIVVFERMYDVDGNLVGEHTDIESESQTVTFIEPETPYIGTEAVDKDTNTHIGVLDKENVLIDTVFYHNLEFGKEYLLKGILMDKATNKPLIVDGKEITAERVFIADESGATTVTFEFDGTFLKDGVEIVVFETLIEVVVDEDGNEKEEVVAEHKDIEDENQTVTYEDEAPSIGTIAMDKATGTRDAYFTTSNTIIDKVTYENLEVGELYQVEGILMDKATGEPLLVDGKVVTASKSFIAMSENGEVDMVFTFNGSKIPHDTQIVVFETLYNEDGVKVAEHTDINDEKQTVSYKVDKPFIEQVKTGDTGAIGTLVVGLGVAILAFAGAAMFLVKNKKKKHFSM